MNRNNYEYYFRDGFVPRPQQSEALAWLDEHMWIGPKCKVIEGPVAVGKSLLSDAVAKREEARGNTTSIVTATNMLLDQYSSEFTEYPCLKGQSHYPCNAFPGNHCGQTKILEKLTNGKQPFCSDICPYDDAKTKCYQSKYAIFNTMSYFYFEKLLKNVVTGKYYPFTDVLIIDEFQEVASLLTAMFEITLWEDDIRFKRGVSASLPAVVELLKKRANALVTLFKLSYQKLTPKEIGKLVDEADRLYMVAKYLENDPDEFVVEEAETPKRGKKLNCLKIRAIRPQKKQLKTLFCCKQVILMSATALDIDVKELGFKEFDKLNLSSPIPVERRKIYAESIVTNSFKNQDAAIPMIAKRIKEIVADRPNQRGVVLTTYRQMELLKEFLKDDFYLFHEKKDRQEVIQWFIDHPETYQIGVFAASFAGLNLKDDIARFIILPNTPLPNFGDAVVQKRIHLDKVATEPQAWYEMQAMKNIIQGSGRASRNEKDFSSIHILDTQFIRIYAKTKQHLPNVFKEAIVWGRG